MANDAHPDGQCGVADERRVHNDSTIFGQSRRFSDNGLARISGVGARSLSEVARVRILQSYRVSLVADADFSAGANFVLKNAIAAPAAAQMTHATTCPTP